MLRLNLKFKLIGLIAGLIVIILTAAGILIIRQVERAMDNENHKRGLAVANDLARFSSSALVSQDIASLRYYVKYTMEQDYVHHVIILDPNGKVIMHNKLSEVGKMYSDKLSRADGKATKSKHGEHYYTEGDLLTDIIVPIEVGGTKLGTVILGYSHAGIEKQIAILKRRIGLMVLTAILVGIAFAVILATYISRPLKKLRDAATEIGKGKRDITLKVKSKDEIGELVDSFNKMAIDLRNTTVSRDLLMKEVMDRKRVEEALRQSEVQKQAILDASIDCIALVDTEMRIVWANKTTASIVNKTPEDLIGHRCHKIFQHSDVSCPGCPCKKALETGNIEHATMYQPAMDTVGESYWEDYGVPVKDESGQVVGVIEICRNVTDKVKAEKALRESEEKLAGIVESVTDAMIMVDEHFNIVWTNDIAKDLFGSEFVSKKCYTVFHGRNKICEPCIVNKCFEDGGVHEFETEIVGASGKNQRTFWCTASVAARHKDGKPKMVVEFLRDITDRKALEHLVLMEQKMVSLGHVAAGIAHEIRNPLSGINVYLATLKKIYDGSDSSEPETGIKVKRIIEQLQSASGKIESVIKRVMDFSKPNILKLALTDVNQSIEEAVNLSSVTLRKSGITIGKTLAPNLPQCHADPHLIEQVILNLITNAAEAMKKISDPKKIEVTSYKENSWIVIEVSDSGPGVPSNIRDRIFDPFFTTKSISSGIGLSISHRIITDHGGSLDVSTSKWGGAEFSIKIPLEKRANTR